MEVREARDELETWMKQELRLFLGFDNVDEICSYLLSLSDQDLEAYLQVLLLVVRTLWLLLGFSGILQKNPAIW